MTNNCFDMFAALHIDVPVATHTLLDCSWRGEAHCDGTSRLYYVESGCLTVRYGGQEYMLPAGALHLIPANTVFDYFCPDSAVQWYIHFNIHIAGNIPLFDMCSCNKNLDTVIFPDAPRYFMRMEKIIGLDSVGMKLQQRGLILFLVSQFINMEKVNTSFTELLPVLQYIEEHLYENVSVTELAALIHMERAHFTRKFKQIIGIAPAKYMRQKRLEMAGHMLRNSDKVIENIAVDTGFCDAYHLSREFKKHFGVSPGVYRRSSGFVS